MIGEEARETLYGGDIPGWVAETYGASGLGVSGFALFVLFAGALGLYNWTETFRVPAIWLTLTTPLIAVLLPVPVLWRLVGIITTALAMLFVGLWLYWRRL